MRKTFAIFLMLFACVGCRVDRATSVAVGPESRAPQQPSSQSTPPSGDAHGASSVRPTVDPPPLRRVLIDEKELRDQFAEMELAEPAVGTRQWLVWAFEAVDLAFKARCYSKAEGLLRSLLDQTGDSSPLFANLSVALGKQGRYEEALKEAQAAAALPNAHTMHVAAITASWLYHLGRHEEAEQAFNAIQPPAVDDPQWPLWQGCRACFAASRGDVETMKDSLAKMKAAGDLDFPKRDVIFDRYRLELWFIAIVGTTVESLY